METTLNITTNLPDEVREPTTVADPVDQLLRRAARCEGEYQQVRKAFNLRIMPFVDPDLLVRVRAMPWVMPDDGRL